MANLVFKRNFDVDVDKQATRFFGWSTYRGTVEENEDDTVTLSIEVPVMVVQKINLTIPRKDVIINP